MNETGGLLEFWYDGVLFFIAVQMQLEHTKRCQVGGGLAFRGSRLSLRRGLQMLQQPAPGKKPVLDGQRGCSDCSSVPYQRLLDSIRCATG